MDHYSTIAAGVGADEESASRMMEEESPAPQEDNKWVVESAAIRQSRNGGWIISVSKHSKNQRANMPTNYETNDYTFGTLADAIPLIEQTFGLTSAQGSTGAVPRMPTRTRV